MNSRTYPRTLNQAFPKTANYGCSIERARPADRAVNWTLAAAVIVIILAICFGAQP